MLRVHTYHANFGGGKGSAFKIRKGTEHIGYLLVIDGECRVYNRYGDREDVAPDAVGVLEVIKHYTSHSGLTGEWEIVVAFPFSLERMPSARVYDSLWDRIVMAHKGDEVLVYDRWTKGRVETVKVEGPPALALVAYQVDEEFELHRLEIGTRFRAFHRTFRAFSFGRNGVVGVYLGHALWELKTDRGYEWFYAPEAENDVRSLLNEQPANEAKVVEILAKARNRPWLHPPVRGKKDALGAEDVNMDETAEAIIKEVLAEASG